MYAILREAEHPGVAGVYWDELATAESWQDAIDFIYDFAKVEPIDRSKFSHYDLPVETCFAFLADNDFLYVVVSDGRRYYSNYDEYDYEYDGYNRYDRDYDRYADDPIGEYYQQAEDERYFRELFSDVDAMMRTYAPKPHAIERADTKDVWHMGILSSLEI